MINLKQSWNVCFQAIPQYIAYPRKTEGDWGNSCKHTFHSLRADTLNLVSTLYAIRGPAAPQANFSAYNEGARPQTTTLTSYHSFQNLCAKFSHSKAILFFSFSLYINVEKVCKSKTTLMSLNWETAFSTRSVCLQARDYRDYKMEAPLVNHSGHLMIPFQRLLWKHFIKPMPLFIQ